MGRPETITVLDPVRRLYIHLFSQRPRHMSNIVTADDATLYLDELVLWIASRRVTVSRRTGTMRTLRYQQALMISVPPMLSRGP